MTDFENFVYEAHSGLRWLVILLTFIAAGWLIYRLAQKPTYDKTTHRIVAAWSGLIGLQCVIGLGLFLILADWDLRHRWEHLVVMTIAVVVAHVYVRLKQRPDRVRIQGALASILATLVLVYLGVALLPQGWTG